MTIAAPSAVTLFFILLGLFLLPCNGIWPKPTIETRGSSKVFVNATNFQIISNSLSPILRKAIDRYQNNLFFPFDDFNIPEHEPVLLGMTISVNSSNENLQLRFDESYSILLQQEHAYEVYVSAKTIWGAIRALETFSQLITYNIATQQYSVNQVPFNIDDNPRFPWRGLMIDTSRHYLEPRDILRTLDAMSYSKFNTLHWHIIDAESFPFVVESYPNLAAEGAYSAFAIYPPAFIQYVVQYAKELGIRVVIETDMPGHTYSWGEGYPAIRSSCPLASQKDEYILNPAISETYKVIKGILNQVNDVSQDDCIHLGGDEAVYQCWLEDPSIIKFMHNQNLTTTQTAQLFYSTVQQDVQELKKRAVYWEDISAFSVPDDSIFEVYSSIVELSDLLKSRKYVINSFGWYLDMQEPIPDYSTYEWVDTWKVMWSLDPLKEAAVSEALEEYFLGGEALMWGDQVDGLNIDSRVWPRACAVADRLWSSEFNIDLDGAKSRLIDFRCRLVRRGIGAGPIDPDYCPLPVDLRTHKSIPGFK